MNRGLRPIALFLLLVSFGVGVRAGEVRTWTLEEGTEVVLLEDHRVPLVEMIVEFPMGTWSRWTMENGAEEAFEIQLYDPEGAFRARADLSGLDVRILMTAWRSRVEVSCHREDLEEATALVRDILKNGEFDRGEVKRWEKNRQLEWKGSLKNPQFIASQARARLLFRQGDPRRSRWEEPRKLLKKGSRLAESRDAILRLPGRVVALAGDLSKKDADAAAKALGLPPVAENPAGIPPEILPVNEGGGPSADRSITLPRLTQVTFEYVRPSMTYGDPDYPAFLVANHVLGGHFYSRLYTALRHEGGETYSARTRMTGGIVTGAYGASTNTKVENAANTEVKIREVLRIFHEGGITEEEREAAAGFLKGRMLFGRQSPRQILDRYLWERLHGFDPGYQEGLIERAASLSLEDVNSFIRDYYDPERFTMIRVEPE